MGCGYVLGDGNTTHRDPVLRGGLVAIVLMHPVPRVIGVLVAEPRNHTAEWRKALR